MSCPSKKIVWLVWTEIVWLVSIVHLHGIYSVCENAHLLWCLCEWMEVAIAMHISQYQVAKLMLVVSVMWFFLVLSNCKIDSVMFVSCTSEYNILEWDWCYNQLSGVPMSCECEVASENCFRAVTCKHWKFLEEKEATGEVFLPQVKLLLMCIVFLESGLVKPSFLSKKMAPGPGFYGGDLLLTGDMEGTCLIRVLTL